MHQPSVVESAAEFIEWQAVVDANARNVDKRSAARLQEEMNGKWQERGVALGEYGAVKMEKQENWG